MKILLFFSAILLSIQLYATEFETIFGESKYYFVVGDKINIRSEPTVDSSILGQLRIGQRVLVLKRSNEEYCISGEKSNWVYVDAGKLSYGEEHLKGWILNYYIGHGKDFKKVKDFYNVKLFGHIGDYQVNFQFFSNGKYTQYYNGRKIEGQLYRFRNLYAAYSDSLDTFFIKDDRICHTNYNTTHDRFSVCSNIKGKSSE